MPNYKQNSITGETYQRSHQVIVDNPIGQSPRISFMEQEIITLSDGRTIQNPVAGCGIEFDPKGIIPLINPIDDSPLGAEGTHIQLQVLLYSLYKQLRIQADGMNNG